MYCLVKKILLLLFILVSFSTVNAQSHIGAGYGTFNVPGASNNFRGFGPTIKYEYIGNRQRTATYLDVSYFTKKTEAGNVSLYDDAGTVLGYADAMNKYDFLHAQLGFKLLIGGDADEKKLLFYLGGGIAFVYANTTTSYKSPDYTVNDDIENRGIFGFHFNSGVQYRIKPVILELRGNLDLVLKQLVNDSDVSNVITNLRLSVLVPISK